MPSERLVAKRFPLSRMRMHVAKFKDATLFERAPSHASVVCSSQLRITKLVCPVYPQAHPKSSNITLYEEHAPCCHILTDLMIMLRSSFAPQLGSQVELAFQKSLIGVSLASDHGLPPIPSLSHSHQFTGTQRQRNHDAELTGTSHLCCQLPRSE